MYTIATFRGFPVELGNIRMFPSSTGKPRKVAMVHIYRKLTIQYTFTSKLADLDLYKNKNRDDLNKIYLHKHMGQPVGPIPMPLSHGATHRKGAQVAVVVIGLCVVGFAVVVDGGVLGTET